MFCPMCIRPTPALTLSARLYLLFERLAVSHAIKIICFTLLFGKIYPSIFMPVAEV